MDLNDLFGQSSKLSTAPAAGRSDAGVPRRAACGSPVLDAGQAVIAGMRVTTGCGGPEEGEMFGRAAAQFDTAGRTLSTAHPTADWEGAAAQVYVAANHRQSGRTDSIGALDRRVHQVLSRQAHQVSVRRQNLDQQADFLADLGHATRGLAFIPGVGQAAKTTVEVAAAATAVQLCEQDLRLLSYEVADNTAELNQLAVGYASLAMPEGPPLPDGEGLPGKDDAEKSEDADNPADHDDEAITPAAGGRPVAVVDPTGPPPTVPMPTRSEPSPAGSAASSGAAPAVSGDPMAGMTAAFGSVGGMIGAIVAPLSAALTGAVGAATQTVSALTSAGNDTTDPGKEELQKEDVDRARQHTDNTDDGAAHAGRDTEPTAAASGDSAAGSRPSPTPDGARAPAPADTLERDARPPAATRPPQ